MKRPFTFLAALTLCFGMFPKTIQSLRAQEPDHEKQILEALGKYLGAIAESPLTTKIAETDFIIGAAAAGPDSALVTRTVFTWFKDSPVMGDESVSLHVFDKWMTPSKDVFYLSAQMWAEINRSSMIGRKAPEIAFEAVDGSYVELFSQGNEAGSGKPAVLYFYDTACSKCREESPALAAANLSGAKVYAIYTGVDRNAWTEYIAKHFKDCGFTHLWDPSASSDKEIKYAVTGTPRMFLIDAEGTIVGRGLNAAAAERLLPGVIASADPYYDLDSVQKFFSYVFSALGDTLKREDIAMVRESIRRKTLINDPDTSGYKRMTAALMSWLSFESGPGAYEGLLDVCVEDVFGMEGIWTTQQDTLEVIEAAKLYRSTHERCPVGSKLPRIKVMSDKGKVCLRRVRGQAVFIYDPRCMSCAEEAERFRGKALLVDLSAMKEETMKRLADAVDISMLPMVYEVDSKGRIALRARYFGD